MNISDEAIVWKVSLSGTGDNPVRRDCMKNGYIRIGWDGYGENITDETDWSIHNGEGKTILNAFINTMKVGDIVMSCYSSRTIDAIGIVTGEYEWHDNFEHYKRVRRVKWLVKGINEDIVKLNDDKTMTLGTVYRLNAITLDKVKSLLDKHEASKTLIDNNKPYVIVIDEFNRGNVSKIFGELITLLEPDKRKGMRDAESVLLPYSKKEFYIPSNVFLVATMNTADRSLDTIDYAIRRRFAFITVKPQEIDDDNFNSELFREVSSLFISNYDEYAESGFDDTIKLLPAETLSEEYRPEDVWIGHSYFIMDGEYALQDRLLFEIIPLLEEYIRDGVLTSEAQQTIDKLLFDCDRTMKLIRLQEQIAENTCIHQDIAQDIIPHMQDGEDIVFSVCRKDKDKEMCLSLSRDNDHIFAKGSYFIGLDWLSTGNVAIQVNPKMNEGYEIDYIRMLNDSLTECENYNHLSDLVTIYFNKPSIKVSQQQDLLSIFLITEYLNILSLIVKKGLKKSFT